jgi:AcrR family transcriptional regulator
MPSGVGRTEHDPSAPGRRKGGNLRQEYQQLTRRRLVDTALDVFEQRGFGAATVEEIVSTARVARATFYLHFKNKMEMVHELTEAIRPSVAELYGDLDATVSGDERPSRAVIEKWVRKAIAWYEVPQHRIIAFVWQELSIEPGGMVVRGISVDEHLPRYLALWPPHQRDAARTRVVLLSHTLSRAYFLARRQALPTDQEGMVNALADFWAAGLFPPAEAAPQRG